MTNLLSSPAVFSVLVLVFSFGGALLGMGLRERLPSGHLCADSRDTIKLGVGLIATMTALVLGLLTASAKGSFDTADKGIREAAIQIITLDRLLLNYGTETAPIRQMSKDILSSRIGMIWPASGKSGVAVVEGEKTLPADVITRQIRALVPVNDEQRWLQTRATTVIDQIIESRWLILASLRHAIAWPFLVALVFWLSITFASFGLLAPRNRTVEGIIFVCAVSVASAVFLILEMDGAFDGVIRVSPDPLLWALERINN